MRKLLQVAFVEPYSLLEKIHGVVEAEPVMLGLAAKHAISCTVAPPIVRRPICLAHQLVREHLRCVIKNPETRL